MIEQRQATIREAAVRRYAVGGVAFVLGAVTVFLGVWALGWPQSFAARVAPFAPFNIHYLHDLGAFQLGIGASLLLAAFGAGGTVVGLGGYLVGGMAHVAAHLVDHGLGGHASDPALLAIPVVLAAVALGLSTRPIVGSEALQGEPSDDQPLASAVDALDPGGLPLSDREVRGRARIAKLAAFAALWLALVTQAFWMLGRVLSESGAPSDKGWYDGLIVAAFTSLAVTGGRRRRLNAALRILIGLAFLGSVGDRFGLIGAPGAPGVSWGNFAAFVAYTRTVNGFLPAAWAPTLAWLATMAETGLGFALLLGVRPRPVALAASGLLVLFGAAMTLSLGLAAAAEYAVGVLAAGALTLTMVDASAFGVGRLWERLLARQARPRPSPTQPNRPLAVPPLPGPAPTLAGEERAGGR